MALFADAHLPAATVRSATMDYRLERRNLLTEIKAGSVTLHDACDAHPELMRVAKNVAEELDETCPVCAKSKLRLVGYLFGPRLGGGGRCVTNAAELEKLTGRPGIFTAYEIEACPDCGWNYRRQSYQIETQEQTKAS